MKVKWPINSLKKSGKDADPIQGGNKLCQQL